MPRAPITALVAILCACGASEAEGRGAGLDGVATDGGKGDSTRPYRPSEAGALAWTKAPQQLALYDTGIAGVNVEQLLAWSSGDASGPLVEIFALRSDGELVPFACLAPPSGTTTASLAWDGAGEFLFAATSAPGSVAGWDLRALVRDGELGSDCAAPNATVAIASPGPESYAESVELVGPFEGAGWELAAALKDGTVAAWTRSLDADASWQAVNTSCNGAVSGGYASIAWVGGPSWPSAFGSGASNYALTTLNIRGGAYGLLDAGRQSCLAGLGDGPPGTFLRAVRQQHDGRALDSTERVIVAGGGNGAGIAAYDTARAAGRYTVPGASAIAGLDVTADAALVGVGVFQPPRSEGPIHVVAYEFGAQSFGAGSHVTWDALGGRQPAFEQHFGGEGSTVSLDITKVWSTGVSWIAASINTSDGRGGLVVFALGTADTSWVDPRAPVAFFEVL